MSNAVGDLEVLKAVAAWAGEMAVTMQMQSAAFATLAREITPMEVWSPVSDVPLPDRSARQALFLAALKLRTDSADDERVAMKVCRRLAKHFGYDARGTAGFYRRSPDGSQGLLVRDGNAVSIGAAGLARIQQSSALVDENQVRLEASKYV